MNQKKTILLRRKMKKLYMDLGVIALLVFLSPVGLYVMFKKSGWSKRAKTIATIIVCAFTLIIIAALANLPPIAIIDDLETNKIKIVTTDSLFLTGHISPADAALTINNKLIQTNSKGEFKYTALLVMGKNIITTVVKKDKKQSTDIYTINRTNPKVSESPKTEPADNNTTITPTQTTTTTPAVETKTPETTLRQAVKDVLGSSLRDTDIQEQYDGGYGVFVQYNASDNLSVSMVKQGIEKTMSDIYIALYHESGQDVRQASVAAYLPMADDTGKTSVVVVYKSVLKKEEADTINFDTDKATLELDIIPGVWKTTMLNVAFR